MVLNLGRVAHRAEASEITDVSIIEEVYFGVARSAATYAASGEPTLTTCESTVARRHQAGGALLRHGGPRSESVLSGEGRTAAGHRSPRRPDWRASRPVPRSIAMTLQPALVQTVLGPVAPDRLGRTLMRGACSQVRCLPTAGHPGAHRWSDPDAGISRSPSKTFTMSDTTVTSIGWISI